MAVVMGLAGCQLTRDLPDGELLVEEQSIAWGQEVDLEGESVLRLVENQRTLGIRLRLRAHELVRPEVLLRRMDERRARGKSADRGLRYWLVESFGEAPVTWDAATGDRTVRNLEALARRAGYLDARGVVELDTLRKQRLAVRYVMDLGALWRVRGVEWSLDGSGIDPRDVMPQSLVQPGMAFDADALDAERGRIARVLQSKGFAEFDEAYIAYEADSIGGRGKGGYGIGVKVVIRPVVQSGLARPHERLRLGSIAVHEQDSDQVHPLRDQVIDHLIAAEIGALYDRESLETTYRRLMRLPAVSRIEMPTTTRLDDAGQRWVDVDVRVWQRKRFGLQTEVDFTRTDVRYGPLLRVSWTDRNVSGRGDQLEWTATAGISSTQPFSYNEAALVPNSGEWSVEANYSILGIPPLGLHRLRPSNAARSELGLAFRRESRPDYLRKAFAMRYGFEFIENEARNSLFNIDLIEFNYTDLEAEAAFVAWLDAQGNPFLKSRFQDYASTLTRVGWRTGWGERAALLGGVRTSLEWSGQLWRHLGDALELPQNDAGAFVMAGVPVAQFVRLECDVRLGTRENLEAPGQIAARAYLGVAWVGPNLNSLPYDRSFFGGGVNGLRGWATRDVGPGGVVDAEAEGAIRGVGDWRAEFNVEYREALTESFTLAIFADAGNVWMRAADEVADAATWPGQRWQSVAWNGGLGARWDFGFFLLRLDGGLRLHDPTQPLGERWLGQTKARGAFHIGIGHPF